MSKKYSYWNIMDKVLTFLWGSYYLGEVVWSLPVTVSTLLHTIMFRFDSLCKLVRGPNFRNGNQDLDTLQVCMWAQLHSNQVKLRQHQHQFHAKTSNFSPSSNPHNTPMHWAAHNPTLSHVSQKILPLSLAMVITGRHWPPLATEMWSWWLMLSV